MTLPFQPPPTLSYQTPAGQGWNNAPPFRSVRGLNIALLIVIAASMTMSLLLVWFLYRQVDLLESVKAGVKVSPAAARANDLMVNGSNGLASLLLIGGIVVWLIWFYRVYANLQTLTGAPTRRTQGWAIGAYFVPFLNLVRVPEMLSETWKGSDPLEASGGAIIGLWWGMWIITGIISRIAAGLVLSRSGGGRPDLDELINGTWVMMAESGCRILAGAFALMVVAGISDRQARKFALIQQSDVPEVASS